MNPYGVTLESSLMFCDVSGGVVVVTAERGGEADEKEVLSGPGFGALPLPSIRVNLF